MEKQKNSFDKIFKNKKTNFLALEFFNQLLIF